MGRPKNFAQKFVEFSNPFLASTAHVFETACQCSIKPRKLGIKKDTSIREEIAAFIDVKGHYYHDERKDFFESLLVFMTPQKTYLNISSRLLGEEYETMCDDVRDVGAEFCNMILGNTRPGLKDLGYKISVAIPRMSIGRVSKIPYVADSPVFILPFESDIGGFQIELCYKLGRTIE